MNLASDISQKSLVSLLQTEGFHHEVISDVLKSGYFLRDCVDPFSGKTWQSVSDFMYGNKGLSSNLETNKFLQHLRGEDAFDPLPEFVRYKAKSFSDIQEILADQRRSQYLKEGSLTFRGQREEYHFKRAIPNPRRANKSGEEVSVFPGLYRQRNNTYSFNENLEEQKSFSHFLQLLEPNNPEVYMDSQYSYDVMRVEQHYATQTAGLDVAFDIETAIFFATNKFVYEENGLANYTKIEKGEHKGVIYCFRFTQPPVKKTEYLIQDFDLFKTYPPERILRQHCGLPMFGDYERNIAACDIDCIIELDRDFDYSGKHSAEELFPSAQSDLFYKRLLEIKDRHPELLKNVVEYKWARK